MSSLAMKLSLPAIPVPMPQAAVSWTAQIIAAIIMGQTLFFKFAGAPEPVYIFTTLGAEPWGRLGTAALELIAVALLLFPRTALLGAGLGMGLMFGAIGSHLTKLGIVVKDDGGLLFAMAIVTFVACAAVVFIRRAQLFAIFAHLRN
jgi:hypothetical protein